MIGLRVPVSVSIDADGGKVRYSGVDWNARLSDDAGVALIEVGEHCVIESVVGTTMLVKTLT